MKKVRAWLHNLYFRSHNMNPLDLFNQVKEMIEKKDFDAAKKFVDDNKDNLGDYLEQAKGIVSGNEMVSGALDKIKGLF